ncbi:MAG: hypothetical protein R2849_00565 [Thermomicrobiales bacterium]
MRRPARNWVSLVGDHHQRCRPPESGASQITFLSYAVPGGEKVHGRILFDQPDSRTFFLYESRLIAGTETLFGVEHTQHYHQLAVHLFDLGQGSPNPGVIPFQQVADPLPYQQVVSSRWPLALHPLAGERPRWRSSTFSTRRWRDRAARSRYCRRRDRRQLSYRPGHADLSGRPSDLCLANARGSSSGIWVIDAASWTIVDWLPETRTAELLLSGDGRTPMPGSQTKLKRRERDNARHRHRDRPHPTLDMPVVDDLFARINRNALPADVRQLAAIEGQVPGSTVSSEPLAAAQLNISRSDPNPGSMVTPMSASFTRSPAIRSIHPGGAFPAAGQYPGNLDAGRWRPGDDPDTRARLRALPGTYPTR